MKVLLVDDEVEFVSTLAERLSFRGIDVDWVSEPETAVSRAKSVQYDLAVLDIKMPRMDGIELKRRIQEVCPGMRIVFLTGQGSNEDYLACSQEAGSDCYLIKPIRLEDLLEKISVIQTQIEEGAQDE